MACWHPRGLRVYRSLEEYCRELGERYSYEEVRSPLVCDSRLRERSGHAEKFADKMFALSVDGHPAALKPMNCPGHADLYALRPRSFRELPLRLSELGSAERGAPTHIRCDNGPEMTAHALIGWCASQPTTTTSYIDPGAPWQNAFAESFHSRVRDELLNLELFSCLPEARVLIEDWREDYNQRRPHGALGRKTPAAFATAWTPHGIPT